MKKVMIQTVILFFVLLSGCVASNGAVVQSTAKTSVDLTLGRGINLGNYLEATPAEGSWSGGDLARESYLQSIRQAGFDHVRIPVRWSAHAQYTAPYTIDTSFAARVETVAGWALNAGLKTVINIHHYNEAGHNIYELNTDQETNRFVELWKQIAARYRDYPSTLYYELLNEPYVSTTMSFEKYNTLIAMTVREIRKIDQSHAIIITGLGWDLMAGMNALQLPADDHLIVTIHFYDPMIFTHQGANWADPAIAALQGVLWPNQLPYSTNQVSLSAPGADWVSNAVSLYNQHSSSLDGSMIRIGEVFTACGNWAASRGVPLWIGEFGAYAGPHGTNDMTSRARWTKYVRQEAEKYGFSWAYWEYNQGFGAYDQISNRWYPELSNALLGL